MIRTSTQQLSKQTSVTGEKAVAVRQRRGAALLASLFVMSAVSMIVIGILQTEMIQFAALRNTVDYDRARYLAEAGMNHGLCLLEADITWRGAVERTEFPSGSGEYYYATVVDGVEGTVQVIGIGESGTFYRLVQVVVKQGG